MPEQPFDLLAQVEPFSRLDAGTRAAIAERFELIHIPRGEMLVRQGEFSDRLYIVVTGRFAVMRGDAKPLAVIAAGQPVGEIAFFAGGPRTANVRAERDSVVLALSRSEFEGLAARLPDLWPSVTSTLAKRLADTTAGRCSSGFVAPKTLALCRAGQRRLHPKFIDDFKRNNSGVSRTLFLDSRSAKSHSDLCGTDVPRQAFHFNDLEKQYDQVVYICDEEPTDWTQKALRQADQVLLIADARAAATSHRCAPNALEELTASLHEPANVRLVLLQAGYAPVVKGTHRWLDPRPFVGQHHHVALGRDADLQRLMRFVNGKALGVVASGGGAFTAAHIGMFQALQEAGYEFDCYGGTSGGAAMAAAFACAVDAEFIDRHTHVMFVERKAMGRWNWPRYSLLDHTVFDACLAELYPAPDVADIWVPYFSAATNLTRNKLEVLRRGPLWKVIRASAAIPALFPPVFKDGEMLVDGCLIDNVPLRPMRELKDGPNVILDLKVPHLGPYKTDTSKLPSRAGLLSKMLMPGTSPSPDAPGPQAVLLSSLLRERRDVSRELRSGDLLLSFPVPEDASVLDWSKHRELRWAAYDFARARLTGLNI